MNPLIYGWAQRHGVSFAALEELKYLFGLNGSTVVGALTDDGKSEAFVSSSLRLQAAHAGYGVWRNNVGAMQDETGRVVRFGLANDSKQLNARIKSSDLIGVKPVMIDASMVGQRIGQFWCRETKAVNWHYTGTERERAQLAWIELIVSLGGDAAFSTGAL